MIIQSITIENFRSFYGEQTISFGHRANSNTSFIYAQNGVGKTNFLNAILWCLHGIFSDGFKRPKDILNWEAKSANRKSYHVTIHFEEGGKEYRVVRSGGDISNFKVFIIEDGNSKPIVQNPSLFINNILPKDMAGYFISDGEGGDLAIDTQGLISIEKSIREILGFTVAGKALVDLKTIKKEVRDELKKVDVENKLGDLEGRIQIFDDSISEKQLKLDDNKRVNREYSRDLDTIEERLFNSDLEQIKRLKLQNEQAKVDQSRFRLKVKNLEASRIDLIRDYSWVAFADRLDTSVLNFIDDAELEGRIPAPFNVSLVKDIMKSSECICGASIKKGTLAYDHIQSLLKTASDPNITNRLHSARARLTAINTLQPNAKKSIKNNFSDYEEALIDLKKSEEMAELVSKQLQDIDDDNIIELEKQRRGLKAKKEESGRTILRLEETILSQTKKREELNKEALKLDGLSPRAQVLKNKLTYIERIEHEITQELKLAEDSIDEQLLAKMNLFIGKYMRQNYKVQLRDGYKIGLADEFGQPIPPSGGQGAIVSFIYISSLISIARDRRDMESSILTAGAIAPLIFDAPFSKLSPVYAENIARELPELVDQLIILMYQDGAENNVSSIVKKQGRLGKEFYMLEELRNPQNDRTIETVRINGKTINTTVFDSPKNKVLIKEAASYV